jgi:molybdenum cofactor guanylyltransferase
LHQKHSNIAKATYGNFARNEMAVLGTTCEEINNFFNEIIQQFPTKKIAIIEADHKANETLECHLKCTDKINFIRIDQKTTLGNIYENRIVFENSDYTFINGNHFEGKNQIIFLDSKKSLEKKLEKLTNVVLIIKKDGDLPLYLEAHFKDNVPAMLDYDDKAGIYKFIGNLINSTTAPIFGLVLAGGKSTRMGTDKGQLKYHGEKTQLKFAADLLKPFCGENVFISLNESQSIIDFPVINDTFIGIGPVGGILSAFQKHPNNAWLIVACDMPYLTEESINQLVTSRNPSKLATSFKSPENDFPEPLITIWEPKAYPKLLQMLAYGIDCPRKTLINSDIELIIHQKPTELQNINTVEAYQKAIIDLSPKIA